MLKPAIEHIFLTIPELEEIYPESKICHSTSQFIIILFLGVLFQFILCGSEIVSLITFFFDAKYHYPEGKLAEFYKTIREVILPWESLKIITWTIMVIIGKYYYAPDLITYDLFTYSITVFSIIILIPFLLFCRALINRIMTICTKENFKSCLTEQTHESIV